MCGSSKRKMCFMQCASLRLLCVSHARIMCKKIVRVAKCVSVCAGGTDCSSEAAMWRDVRRGA